VSQSEITKKSIKRPILAFKVIEFSANREPVYDFLFSALVQGDSLQIYGKALRFLKLVFQAADREDMVILSCTVFD